MDYTTTISALKERGLISPDAAVFVGMESLNSTAFWAGAIGVALAMSKMDRMLFAVTDGEIKLFDIAKSDGKYLETMTVFENELIVKAKMNKRQLSFKYKGERFSYNTAKKFNGYKQVEEIAKAMGLIKSKYTK